ncbi:MAG: cyclic 2,3-diphosphoglycerate synthase [Candidatus Sedimenticola sp. 20ELBAFRAG]
MGEAAVKRVIIMGAAGRDFHNFNLVFRGDPSFYVEAFTAAQIPDIADRCYPAALAGPGYPDGIPILDESELEDIIRSKGIDQVVFAYSDVSRSHVMHTASRVLAAGADFRLLSPERTMLKSRVPVIAVSAVRTGCGKSPLSRWLSKKLKAQGLRIGAMRHPMPYGDLSRQAAQRFESIEDLAAADCTVEEREEYEPHLAHGNLVYAGVDYERILSMAEKEVDVIIWDGGNNDAPFLRPDLHIVMVDPLRPGHESSHYPGEVVLRLADVVVISKSDSAEAGNVEQVICNVQQIKPGVRIVRGALPITLDDPAMVKGKRVLVVEDGPTTTHGGMAYGAGYMAAVEAGAGWVVDPRDAAVAEIQSVYATYDHIGKVLPAVGYHPQQLNALEASINGADADVVVIGTPCDLAALIKVNKPAVRARYEFAELGEPVLSGILSDFITGIKTKGAEQ